jgi:DNA polymerase (family X)
VSHVTNRDAAEVLFNVATILELAEDNPYRVRAYRRAARLLLRSREDAKVRLSEGGELELPGLGPRLRRKLGELLATGRMGFYVELCADMPEGVARLMEIPTVGPKTALRLHEELGLATAADVYAAAQAGKIRQLYGFGPNRERQLLAGAEAVLAGRPKVYAPVPPATEDELAPQAARVRLVPVAEQLALPEAA